MKKRRSSNHKRERRKLTSERPSEQHRIAISIVVHFRLGDMAEATASRFVSLDDKLSRLLKSMKTPTRCKKQNERLLC